MAPDKRIIAAIILLLGATSLYLYHTQDKALEASYTYTVVNKYPHDPEAFTQGLVYHDGVLYEGTGLYERSSLRIVDPVSGELEKIVYLESGYFGEGVAILGDYVYQVTWRNNVGFVYDLDLKPVGSFSIEGEGWGLTDDDEYLILSDGTSTISFLDKDSLTIDHSIRVTSNGTEIRNINELEYINGMIYANIWQTDKIAVIDPFTGVVTSWIDLSGLQDELDTVEGINVLNGIAYDESNDRIFVTGKLWPNLFEIELVPK